MSSASTRVQLGRRFPVLIKASLNSGKGELFNLSPGGAYIATGMMLLPQAEVLLRVILPEEKRWIDLEGVVAWENRSLPSRAGLPPGYGLRFTRVPEDSLPTLDSLMAGSNLAQVPAVQIPVAPAPSTTRRSPSLQPENQEADSPPYRLSEGALAARIPAGAGGVFVLYYNRAQEALVGRADRDLRETLAGFVGQYGYFWFETLSGVEEIYRRECQLFHHFGGDRGQLDNREHPSPPARLTRADCPECAPRKTGGLSRPSSRRTAS